MADLFWFSDAQWAVLEPFMPRNRPGARRVDDRRTISGIVHVIKSGCRWRDCPPAYGPHTTVYNRFNRWSRRGLWHSMLAALAQYGWVAESAALDHKTGQHQTNAKLTSQWDHLVGARQRSWAALPGAADCAALLRPHSG